MNINGEWFPADWRVVRESVTGREWVLRGKELLTPAEALALRDALCTSSKKRGREITPNWEVDRVLGRNAFRPVR